MRLDRRMRYSRISGGAIPVMKAKFMITLAALASGCFLLAPASAQDVASADGLSPAEQAQAGEPPKDNATEVEKAAYNEAIRILTEEHAGKLALKTASPWPRKKSTRRH